MRLHSRRARASATSLISENVTRFGVTGVGAHLFPPPWRPRGGSAVAKREIVAFESASKEGDRASETGAELVPRMPLQLAEHLDYLARRISKVTFLVDIQTES